MAGFAIRPPAMAEDLVDHPCGMAKALTAIAVATRCHR
jgi:hypothetical protein